MYIIPHGYNAVKSVIKGDGFGELGKLNQLKEIADSIMPNLSRGFLNLGRSFKSLVTHTGAFKDNIKAAGSNFKEFFSANKIKLFVAAIMLAKAALTYFSESAQRTFEESQSRAETQRKAAETIESENKTLNELIIKYKEIAKSGIADVEKRTKIAEVQQQINKLVGAEASDLNLVNGNLETQLGIWKDINEERLKAQFDSDWNAASASGQSAKDYIYHNAPKQFGIDFNDWGAGSNEYSFILGDEDSDKLEKIIDIIEKTRGVDTTSYTSGAVRTEEPWMRITLTGDFDASDFKARFKEILNNLEKAGYDSTDTYGRISQAYENIFGADSEYQKSFTAYQKALSDTIALDEEAQKAQTTTINSLSDYLSLREKIIDSIEKNEKVSTAKGAGWISDKDVSMGVDEFLAQFSNLSGYYISNSVADILSRLKQSLKDDKALDEFDEWVNSLTNEDKELVVKIDSEFTSEKVKEQLESYSEGGSVDLLVRPTIDNSELNKAGWTDENGNPLPEGKATVNTSTYSINDGQANAKALNFTPIIVDEDGNYKGTLSPEALEKYAMDVLNGVREDDLHLQIGGEWTGADAIDKAVDAAKKIHQYQNFYYLGGDKKGSETAPLETYQQTLDEYREDVVETADTVEKNKSKIKSIFESKGSDEDNKDKTFGERVKTYRENITSLNEALEKFRNGELDEDAFHGLVEKFPQLAGRTTDLDVAITELMDDMDSTMVSDFDNQFGKLDTQEDIDALKEYERQVLSTRETAAKFQSDIENLVSVFGTVKSAVEEYNENGFLSLSSLQSILSLNDKYISALTNEQGALDLSTESYKKLVEAELIELKAQTLQNSLDTVRNIDNRTEALAYLNEREHSAAQASLDLADAQWQEALSAAAVKDIQQGTGDLYQRTVIAARKAYDTRIALIDEYAKTAFTIGELSTATDEYSKALNNEKEALENSKKALEDQKNALEDTKQGYEDALSAVKDLVSWVQDYIKQIKNDEIDALQKKKESIDKLIESQKELLDAEKEEYEWNKTIAEKQNTVAKDALAASIASLDDSSAGRKAQKQANDKLVESRTDMLDALYEHEIEQRKEALDKLKEEQDEYYDNLIKEIQDYLSNEVQLYKDACSMIDNDSGDLYGKLLWYCRNYTTTTEAEFNHMWNSAQSAMEQYNAANLGTFELLNNLQGRIYEVDGAIDAITQSISSYESAIDGVQSKLDDLSKQAQRTIADVRAAANAEDEWSKPKWIYSWQGNDYKSWKSDRDAAISDIIKQIESRYGGRFPASAATIYGTIRKYASGTNYAAGGLSLVGERGAEFKVLNTGDGIVKNQIVNGITALGTNPAQFIADAGKLLMKNLFGGALSRSVEAIRSNNQIAPSIHINVQGDATQSTVDALKAQAKKIMNDTIKTIHSDTLMKTYSSRVR